MNDGGQAIVGNVSAGRGRKKKVGNNPMRAAHYLSCALPFAVDVSLVGYTMRRRAFVGVCDETFCGDTTECFGYLGGRYGER